MESSASRAAGDAHNLVNAFLSPEYQVGDKRPSHRGVVPETQLPVEHSIDQRVAESIQGSTASQAASAASAQGVVNETPAAAGQSDGSDHEADAEGEDAAAAVSENQADVPWNAVANDDGTFTVTFALETATADSAFRFFTTKMLGTHCRRGMACYLRSLLKLFVKTMAASSPNSPARLFFAGLLSSRGPKALASAQGTADFKCHFTSAWTQHRDSICDTMNSYINGHPLKVYQVHNTDEDPHLIPQHLLPKHGDINALARVVVLMSEPEVQKLWDEIANEDRSREAIDSHNAQLVVKNERLETELLDKFFNSAVYACHCSPSVFL